MKYCWLADWLLDDVKVCNKVHPTTTTTDRATSNERSLHTLFLLLVSHLKSRQMASDLGKIVDLKVDRNLLNPKFEGYKVSLDAFPTYSLDLTQRVFQCRASDSQWTLQHVRLFVEHNHLVPDLWPSDETHVYAALSDCGIYRFNVSKDGKNTDKTKVFEFDIPTDYTNRGDKFNATLSFASSKLTFFSNGCAKLWLCDRSAESWKVLLTVDDLIDGSSFVILDSVVRGHDERKAECVVEYIKESEGENDGKTVFTTTLVWASFCLDSENLWKLSRIRKLDCPGSIECCALSRSTPAICVVSAKPVNFVFDSEKPVVQKAADVEMTEFFKDYAWSQTGDEVLVLFSVSESVKASDIEFQLEDQKLTVSLRNCASLLSGGLFAAVNLESSTFALNGNRIEVKLSKREKNQTWPNVLAEADDCGIFVSDAMLLNSSVEVLKQFTTGNVNETMEIGLQQPCNTEELEECDEILEDELMLSWFDGETHEIVRQTDLSGRQWLFSLRVDAKCPPHMCLRHDVDGLLWRLPDDPRTGTESHVSTLDAFGYVQAGKEMRKFTSCSPDFSFAVIAECNKHAFVYWREKKVNSELRNRKTSQMVAHVSKQQVISLTNDEDVVGLMVSQNFVLILTNIKLYVVRVSDIEC